MWASDWASTEARPGCDRAVFGFFLGILVSLTVASWNQLVGWLRHLQRLRRAG
jgi:hypothetical protein